MNDFAFRLAQVRGTTCDALEAVEYAEPSNDAAHSVGTLIRFAIAVVRAELTEKRVIGASIEESTGDLHFEFEGGAVLEVFNFTGFEIWTVTFADGTQQFSNYVLDH